MRRPLTTAQSIILTLLWVAICYLVLVGCERIDGPLILTLLISGVLVFVPIIRSIKSRNR